MLLGKSWSITFFFFPLSRSLTSGTKTNRSFTNSVTWFSLATCSPLLDLYKRAERKR